MWGVEGVAKSLDKKALISRFLSMSHDAHQSHYDQLAADWDLRFTAVDLDFLTYEVDRFGVKPGMDIVDLGCGTGILFDLLRRRVGESGTVTGVDFSFEMAFKALKNFPFPNVNVVDGDVTQLPLQSDRFDMAVSFSAFCNFSDKAKSTREIHRILRNGSRFHVIHLFSSKELSERHHRLGGVIECDELPNEAEMKAMLTEGGFGDVSITDKPGLYLASAIAHK